jgi:hypothetical protein
MAVRKVDRRGMVWVDVGEQREGQAVGVEARSGRAGLKPCGSSQERDSFDDVSHSSRRAA